MTYIYVFCIYIILNVFSNLKNKINEKYAELLFFVTAGYSAQKRQLSTVASKCPCAISMFNFTSSLISSCFPAKFLCAFTLHYSVSVCAVR
jgi:hypothetical protein